MSKIIHFMIKYSYKIKGGIMELFNKLFNTLGYIIALTFFFTRFEEAKYIFIKEKQNKRDILLLSIFFSAISIFGTYVGIGYKGSIINIRNTGVIVGGILAGSQVAIITSFVSGCHRIFLAGNDITAIPCGIATIFSGFIVTIITKKINKNNIILGFISGIIVENLSMFLIFCLLQDKKLAKDIIEHIYFPMVLINSLGISGFIAFVNEILKEKENEAGMQAKLALEIANKTLPYFRKGENLNEVCRIVLTSLKAQMVIITDNEKVIANSSVIKNFNIVNQKIQSNATKKALSSGETIVLNKNFDKDIEIYRLHEIKSCIISPFIQNKKIVGCLKIYFNNTESLTARKKFLAIGLSQLFSTQMELSKIENLKVMAKESEVKFLQNQINPHFLFNALNTIISFIRIDPNKAREIIIDLSTYLRYNLENIDKMVPLYRELEQVNAYLNIEKVRFKDRFSIKFIMKENINNIKIPSLIIQPLVENSIKHGILKSKKSGILKISIVVKNKNCYFNIEDNGIGIEQYIIDNLDTTIDKNIGLKNVHNRLKLLYGEGLHIKRLKEGTKIYFKIPINKLEEDL